VRDYLVFAVAPYVAALAFLPVCAARYLLWRARGDGERPAPLSRGITPPIGTAGRVALLVVALGHVLALVFPEYLLQWNRQFGRLLALEASGAIAAVVAIAALVMSAIRSARGGHHDAPADVVARTLVLIAMVSGLAVAAIYRWASIWSAVTLLPYLYSLIGLDPKPSLVTYLPPLIKLHVASAVALVAVLPFTGTALAAIAGIDRLARRALAPLGPRTAAAREAAVAGTSGTSEEATRRG
jgi:nitrate reductase gamma subunit